MTAVPSRRFTFSYRRIASLVSLGVAALIWEILGRALDLAFLPPLTSVLVRLGELVGSGTIIEQLGASLQNLAIGLAISISIGVMVGALMGIFPRVDAALSIYVNAMVAAPPLVFAPILLATLGTGRASIIAVIVAFSLFIIIINTAAAMETVPEELLDMARSFNASGWRTFVEVFLPAAMPLMMAGIRLGVGRAVKGMINGEMFIALVGLGAIVERAGTEFDAETILAVLLVMVAVALVMVGIVQLIERRLTSWLPDTARARTVS